MSESDYWFKTKRYGLGARPVTWQGWAVSYAYLAVLLSLFWLFAAARDGSVSAGVALLWVVVVAVATLLFVRFARAKANGGGAGASASEREFAGSAPKGLSGVVECSRSRTCT